MTGHKKRSQRIVIEEGERVGPIHTFRVMVEEGDQLREATPEEQRSAAVVDAMNALAHREAEAAGLCDGCGKPHRRSAGIMVPIPVPRGMPRQLAELLLPLVGQAMLEEGLGRVATFPAPPDMEYNEPDDFDRAPISRPSYLN